MERLVLVHGSVVGGRATWREQRPRSPRVRAGRRRAARGSRRIPRRATSTSRRTPAGRATPRAGRPPRRALLRRRRRLLAAARRARGDSRPSRSSSRRRRGSPAGRPRRRGFRRGRPARAVCDGRDGPTRTSSCAASCTRSARTSTRRQPLPPELEQGARALAVERGPWEADVPLDALAAGPFPKLVVSGAHHPAFDAICDVLERELDAERLVAARVSATPPASPGVQRPTRRLRSAFPTFGEERRVTTFHLQRLDHVSLNVRDRQGSIAWYLETLAGSTRGTSRPPTTSPSSSAPSAPASRCSRRRRPRPAVEPRAPHVAFALEAA